MQKQGLFLTTLENNDPIASMKHIQDLDCSWLAIRVYGKVKNKLGIWQNRALNYKGVGDDKWLANYFREAGAKDIKLYLYADPLGADPAGEMKQLLARISAYIHHPAFGGVLIQVDDQFNKRTVNCVNYYCNTLSKAGITVNWVNVAADLRYDLMDAFNRNCEYGLKLVTAWKYCIQGWNDYGIGDRFIPLWPMKDIPERGYKYDLYKSRDFWKVFMQQDMPAIGLWDTAVTYPLKIAETLKWTKGDVVPNDIGTTDDTNTDTTPVIPADVPTEDEIRRVLMYLLQTI